MMIDYGKFRRDNLARERHTITLTAHELSIIPHEMAAHTAARTAKLASYAIAMVAFATIPPTANRQVASPAPTRTELKLVTHTSPARSLLDKMFISALADATCISQSVPALPALLPAI